MQHWCSFQSREVVKMVEGNVVPGKDEIGERRDVVAENNVQPAADRWQEDYQRTVGFQPQDGTGDRQQVAGYDRSLGYDRIAVGNTALGQRIDNITNLLAMGERSAGSLQDVNRYYGRAQKEADDLFSVAAQNVMKGREDYRAILAAQSPQEVFQGVEASIQKQAQAIQQQLQQERDPARVRRLEQILAMEQERAQTLERMKQTQNPQELNRLLMYDAFSAQRIDLSQKMLNERDPNQVRLMAEAEQNLHTVQRAPGFTRANYGMLLMRMGQYDPTRPDNAALRALQDAASVDPEMVPNPNSTDPARRMGDPNFMRVASEITRMRPEDPRFAQAMAPIFNRDVNRSPAPLQAAENINPNARYSQVQEQPYQPARDGANRPLEQTRVTDQSQGVTPLVNGKTPFQRVQELGKVADAQGLTPDVRQSYASIIQDSDKGTSPRVAELQAQLAQLEQRQQALAQKVDEIQKSPEIAQLVQSGMAKLKARPEAEQQQLKTLTEQLQKTQDKAEREKLLGDINKICPEFVQVTKLLEEKLKPFTDELTQIQTQGSALANDLVGEMNQSSATRMEFAEKLMKSDKPEDKEMAKQLLIESVAKAKPEQREAFAQYAQSLGLTKQELEAGLAKVPQQQVERASTQQQGVEPTGERTGAGKLIDENKKAFDAAQDKKAKLAEMQESFKKAITDADKEFADVETRYNQLDAAHTKAANEMPAEDKAKFQKMLTAGTPEAEKTALQQELMTKYANIVQMETEMKAIKDGALDLALNRFEARYEYARASNLGGDDATAKAMLSEGIKTLTKDVGTDITAKVMEDPGVADLAKKVGVDAAVLMQQAAAEAQTAQPGADTTGGATGDLQGTLRVANARMQKGDIAGAKQAYEQAIKMVDASFNPEENNRKIKEAQDLLEKGNLTIEQRLQKQQEVASYFNQAYQAFDIRSGYARILAHPNYNQNAAAEVAFKDAIAAADRVPVQAMKRQMGLLANDIGTFQTAYEQATGDRKTQIEQAQAFLSEFSNTLNGQTTGGGPAADKAWMNTQINARKDLASFYVRLVTDVDEQGQPIIKADGTPRYVPDASKVFKPEEGMKAIDDAKAKYKELHGTDLDKDPAKDPTLAILAKGIYDNSPAELQKKYQNVSRYWDEAKASIPTLIAGVGTAVLLSKFKPVAGLIRAEASLGSKALGWGTALAGGSTAATFTHHTMMNNVFGREDNTWGRSIAAGTGLTLGGVGLMKVPKFLFRNADDVAMASVIERGGAGGVRFTQAAEGVPARIMNLDELKAAKDLLGTKQATMTAEAFAAEGKQLDALIRASQNRDALWALQAGKNGAKLRGGFDAELARAATGADKAALVDRLGGAVKKFAPELRLAQEAPKYSEILAQRGGIVVKDQAVVEKLIAADLPVIRTAAGENVLAMRTAAEVEAALKAIPSIEPKLLGAKNLKTATAQATKLLDDLAATGLKGDDLLAPALKNATLENQAQLNLLRNLVPEAAAEAKLASRFGAAAQLQREGLLSKSYGFATGKFGAPTIGLTAGFGHEAYSANAENRDFSLGNAAMKSALVAGGLWGGGKVVEYGHGLFKPMGAKTFSDISHSRFMAGSLGGTSFYAGSNYPTAWQHMYGGEGNLDPKTGKPYEFNLSNAIVAPAWKNAGDNIFVSSFLLGGMAAKPGQALLAQAPWANSRMLWKPFSATGHLFTGNTWNYLGARSMPLLGEVGPALSTNMAMGQFDLLNNLSNRDAGRQYTDALKMQNEAITDESQESIVKRQQELLKQQEQQRQQQQQQQQEQQKADQQKKENPQPGTEQGAVTPRAENTDLTGGAPQ